MDLREIVSPASVLVHLKEGSKEEIIRQLVAVLPLEDGVDRDDILGSVLEREAVMSTGIGRGVAIPHGKSEAVSGVLAAVGVAREPVPFEAIDGKPVKVFFLIVSNPMTTNPHIQVLSEVSKLLNDDGRKSRLMGAERVEDVLETL